LIYAAEYCYIIVHTSRSGTTPERLDLCVFSLLCCRTRSSLLTYISGIMFNLSHITDGLPYCVSRRHVSHDGVAPP